MCYVSMISEYTKKTISKADQKTSDVLELISFYKF